MPVQRQATIRFRTKVFDDACALIDEIYARDGTLDEVARHLASSRRQVQRAFTEIGGTTFRDHLAAVRMRRAAELLAKTRWTVRDVAAAVGYRQPAQFAKAFRRHHGVTPIEYRTAVDLTASTAASAAPGRIATVTLPQSAGRASRSTR